MEKQLFGLGIVLAILAFGLLTLIVDLRRGQRQAVLSRESAGSDSASRPGRSARAPRGRG